MSQSILKQYRIHWYQHHLQMQKPVFRATSLTLTARTQKEAKRKAEKIWAQGGYGDSSIIAVQEPQGESK